MASLLDLLKKRWSPRPKFTGRAGYNQRRGEPMDPYVMGTWGNPDDWSSPEIVEMFGGAWGSKVDPHLAAAAGGPGWGSGMAPSTMAAASGQGTGGLNTKAFWEAMAEQEPYVDQTTAPPGGFVGESRVQGPVGTGKIAPLGVTGGAESLAAYLKRIKKEGGLIA